MDGNIKTLLQDKAEEMRIGATIPEEVLRRSRRRRTATAGVAALLTIGVVAGAFVGARTLLRETGGQDRRLSPGGTVPEGTISEPYPFIFPTTKEELETTQEQVANGSMPMWTDPRGVAELFAVNVMGWDPEDVEVDVRGDQPITAVITNPSLSAAAGAEADLRTSVFMVEIPGPEPRIYAVLGARAEVLNVEPVGPDDLGSDGVLAFRGTTEFVPDGGTVELAVTGSKGGGGASARIRPDGRFEIREDIRIPVSRDSIVSVALMDRAGQILALTSAQLETPILAESESEASEPVQVGPPVELPGPVARTRRAILDAARADDYAALRDLIPERGFTFSFGGERDPIAYWRYLESEGHVPVFGDIFPMVLGTEPGRVRGGYIWPAQAGEDPSEWDERDLEALRLIHLEQDIRRFQQIGLYTDWRVEIARDGTWLSFVQGD